MEVGLSTAALGDDNCNAPDGSVGVAMWKWRRVKEEGVGGEDGGGSFASEPPVVVQDAGVLNCKNVEVELDEHPSKKGQLVISETVNIDAGHSNITVL